MAEFRIYDAMPANRGPAQLFQPGAVIIGFNAGVLNYQNPDGSIVAMGGSGIVVDDHGGVPTPTAGTINTMVFYDSAFTIQRGYVIFLNLPAVDLHTAWITTPSDVASLVFAGNDQMFGSVNDDIMVGRAGGDAITAGDGNDYIEPGAGSDFADGEGGTRDMLSYADANADPTVKAGIAVDLGSATVTDPWGNTDTIAGFEGVRSTNFADTLTGTAADERFEPLGGADTVDGGAGQDQIRFNRDAQYGGAAGVTVNLALGTATDGFGTADSFTNIEAAVGTDKADTMSGGNAVLPNGSSWEIYALGGDDTITAGTFDLYVEPGAGNDKIAGGAGADQVSYAEYTGAKGATFDLPNAKITDPYGGTDTLTGSIEILRGTPNADIMLGDGLNNVFRGLGGADTIKGGAGNDQVRYDRDAQYGGTAAVTVNLATGIATDGFGATDTLSEIENVRGSAGADTLTGSAGANLFQGLAGADKIDGAGGQDTADYSADAGAGGTAGVTVNLALGTATDGFGATDTLTSIEAARGTNAADTLTGGNAALPGTDIYELYGQDGDDTLAAGSYDAYLAPGAGDDTVTGGAGNDQIAYEEYTGTKGAVINLATGIVNDPYGGTDKVSGVEGVRGTRNADTITGTAGNNFFRGLAGDDAIDGGLGTDQVRYDRDALAGGTKAVSVDLAAGKATDGFGNTDTLSSIENVRGSNGADTLLGDANNNSFQGFGGADIIDGRGGQDIADYSADTLAPGVAGVTVNLALGTATDGQSAKDTLTAIEGARGTAGADTLTGGDAPLSGNAYELYGGAGDDTITAGAFDMYAEPGAGNDTITAGAGFDQVSYSEYTGANGADINLGALVITDPYGGKDTLVGVFEGARGTRNADVLVGNDANNQFRGLNGSDFINGGVGLDRVRYDRDAGFGGTAGVTVDLGKGTAVDGFGNADTLVSIEQVEGTASADTLIGGDLDLGVGTSYDLYGRGGDDILTGGAFAVYVEPGAGNDTITGGAGPNDQISYSDFTNGVGVTIDLTKGSLVDPLGFTDSFTGIEGLRGTASADTLTGDAGNNFFAGLRGADTIDGAGGLDLVRYDRDANNGGAAAVKVDLGAGTATDGFGDTDTLISIENARGTNGADSFVGSAADNRFQGLGGADSFDGKGGNDTVDYSRDASEGGKAGVTVDLAAGKATDGFGAPDTLVSIENVIGTAVADTLTGNGTNNRFTGGLGDDSIDGGFAIDTAVFAGPRAGYTITPSGGSFVVKGADGTDTLTGIELASFDDITVDLGTPTFSVIADSPSQAEGTGAGTTAFSFRITRVGGTFDAQDIAWSVAGAAGTGTSPADAADFLGGILPSGTASFAIGEVQKFITIAVVRDAVGEFNERFAMTLGAPPAGSIVNLGSAQSLIQNDDISLRVLSSGAADQAEGNSGSKPFVFVVQRAGNTAGTTEVDWSVQGSGATPANAGDFLSGVLPSGTLTFLPGETSKTVTASVAGDTAAEADEGFALVLANPTGGAVLSGASAARTILNDDAVISIAAASASKPEGTGTTTGFTFTVSRTGTGTNSQSVSWAVAGAAGSGTAPADAADFAGGVLPSGILTFAVGETSKTLTVPVAADALGELNDRFAVTLSAPTGGAALGTASAQGVIQNDDTSLRVLVTGAADQAEGNSGSKPFVFTVQRQGAVAGTSTVDWAVSGTGAFPALGADFVGGVLPGGSLTFLAGETAKTVTASVAGDLALEPGEGFQLVLSNPVGAAISVASAARTILNDDSAVSIAATSANKPEGTGGSTAFTFTATRAGSTATAQSVSYAVSGIAGTGTQPADAADFGGTLPAGTISFAIGQDTQLVTVNVAADSLGELNERFAVTLSAPTGGLQLGNPTAQGIIQNDDSSLSLAAVSADQLEGDSGSTGFVFRIARTGSTTGTASVDWSVAGTGSKAADAADFTGGALPSGSVSFAAGETQKFVTVAVAGDTAVETNEGFQLTLANAVGAAIGTGTAARTILSDDGALSIAPLSANKAEGNSFTVTPFTFTVTRNGGDAITLTATYSAAPLSGSGTVPVDSSDFAIGAFPSGTVNLIAGQTSQVITIPVNGDFYAELNERFSVTLTSPAPGTSFGTASAGAVIQNDDFVSTPASQALTGTDAPDTFQLGGGLDTVLGKGGTDLFVFQAAAIGPAAGNTTTLQDFSRAAGEKLDLSAIDAIFASPGDDPFGFIGTAAFTGTAGQLRWEDQGTQRLIQGDTNGDSVADLTIAVTAAGPVDAGWFVL